MDKIKLFIQENYDKGDYIFPNTIAYNLNMKIEYVYECCEQLVTEGILQKIYAVSHGCRHSEDVVKRYTSIDDIPKETFCNICMCEYDSISHIEIEYELK